MIKKMERFTFTLIFLQGLSYQAIAKEANYIWSVVPQFTGTAVHRDWTPIIKYIENKTGYHFKLKIYDSIPEFEKAFLNGEPDIAYMNPYHAVMAMNAQGYTPIIRNKKRTLAGIIMVRSDSNIDNIQQLDGKDISFPSPNAFAASLYLRALMSEKENIKYNAIYAGTHSNSYRYVLVGKTIATGAVKRTLLKEQKYIQQNLKIIYTTPAFPSHPLTAHKRLPDKVKKSIQSTMIKLNQTEKGKKMLSAVLLSNPIKAEYSTDYYPLIALNLEKYLASR